MTSVPLRDTRREERPCDGSSGWSEAATHPEARISTAGRGRADSPGPAASAGVCGTAWNPHGMRSSGHWSGQTGGGQQPPRDPARHPPTLPKARCASLTAGRAPPLRQGVLLARHLVRQVIVHHPPRGCCGWNPAWSLMQTGRPSPCTGRAGRHRPLKPERAPPSVPSPTSHLPAARWPAAHSLCPPTPAHVLAGE